MAFCINCGQKLAEEAKFCANCGMEVNGNKTHQRKVVYDGELHKCPSCGERLDSFVTVCPVCGYELRGARATSVVNDLVQKLERTKSFTQKSELIQNFYIPNTKEDIYEFIILTTTNIKSNSCAVEAWYVKLEQAYQKAKLSFGNEPEFQYVNQLYSKAKKWRRIKSFVRNVKKSKLLQRVLLGTIGAIMMIAGYFVGSLSGDSDSPYYMLAMVGLFPLIGAFGMDSSNGNTNNNTDENQDD